MTEPGSNSDSRTKRGLVGLMAMVGVTGFIWLFNETSDYPPWFLGVMLGLTAINLANWVIEPADSAPQARCRKCGVMRVVHAGSACVCGAQEVRMPGLNRIALALIVGFLGTIGITSLWAALTQPSHESRVKGFMLGMVLTTLAIVTAAEISGHQVTRRLRRALGSTFPYEFEKDIRRLKLYRHLAIRVILLVLSVALFTASVMYLLRHPPPA